MKYTKFLLRSIFCLTAAVAVSSCDNDDLIVGGVDTGNIMSPDGNVVYVTDALGNSEGVVFSFAGSGTFNVYGNSSKTVSGDCSVKFSYTPDAILSYNADNGTDYEAVPEAMVTLSNDGVVAFEAGALKTSPLSVTVSGNGQLDPTKTYAVPLTFVVNNGQPMGGENSIVVLVRDTSEFPGTDKTYNGAPGMKMIAVVEVNDFSPLNPLGFTLKDSGKQLFDMVVLFSANINYDSQTGRVYVSRNENVQAILDNREKYIQPLQDRGIKVILGILGNHDESGISTLSDAACKDFAQEVKNVCDAYALDGVFLDDEYTDKDKAAASTNPLFQAASYKGSSRMAYEIKMAQPERLVLSYKWEELYNAEPIDGKQPGEFFDYVLNDYCDAVNPVETYPGLRQDQAGTGSWNCTDANWYKARWMPGTVYNFSDGSTMAYNDIFPLAGMRDAGYGALMVYNFYCNPGQRLTPRILENLQLAAQTLYGEDLQYDGLSYDKDWK